MRSTAPGHRTRDSHRGQGHTAPEQTGTPRVTVCVPTRDRSSLLTPTLQSLGRLQHESFEVIVVDQSSDDLSQRAFRTAVGDDGRFVYVPSATRGRSAALNVAVSHARGHMLAFIDDDCLAPPHWLSEMEAALAQAPQVAAVCAAINAPDHDPSEVFMPHWSPLRIRIQRSRWPVSALCGAANMIFWADVYRDLGGFDEMTTVGAPLKAGEDQDILYRLLRRGYAVRYVPSPAVLHCGRHPVGDDLRHLMRSYALGAGAVAMKHVRLRDPGIILHLFYWWFGQLRWGRLIRLRRGNGAINFLTFARGMALSFRYPLDRRNRVYVSPRESSPEYQRNHPGLRDPSTM